MFATMPHVQAVTNHPDESQKIKVRDVLNDLCNSYFEPCKLIP